MRLILILSIFALQGCTILAKDKYFAVVSPESSSRDKFHQIDCYEKHGLRICSNNLHAKSLLIGIVVPILPQSSDSRLSYNIKREASISVENMNEHGVFLRYNGGIDKCISRFDERKCNEIIDIEISPKDIVKINLPAIEKIEFVVYSMDKEKSITVKPKIRFNVHLVSV